MTRTETTEKSQRELFTATEEAKISKFHMLFSVSQRIQEIQYNLIKFSRFFHIWHVGCIGHDNLFCPSDLVSKQVSSPQDFRIIKNFSHDQYRNCDIIITRPLGSWWIERIKRIGIGYGSGSILDRNLVHLSCLLTDAKVDLLRLPKTAINPETDLKVTYAVQVSLFESLQHLQKLR